MLQLIVLLIISQGVNGTFRLSLDEGQLGRGTALEANLNSRESLFPHTGTFLSTE